MGGVGGPQPSDFYSYLPADLRSANDPLHSPCTAHGRAGSFRARAKTFRQYLAEKIAKGELFRHLQKRYPRLAALALGVLIPDGGLHFADVRLAQHQHTQAALADAAADGCGKLASKQHLVEWQVAAVIATSDGELAVQ